MDRLPNKRPPVEIVATGTNSAAISNEYQKIA